MKKVIVVTSKKLEKKVKELTNPPPGYLVEVWGLPIDVVALLRPRSLIELIKKEASRRGVDLKSYDMVLVSGMIPGDLSEAEEYLGVKVVKGTKTLSDYPILISHLDELEDKLSAVEPLEEALEKYKLSSFKRDLEREYETFLKVGSLKLPLRSPPAFLAAEILDNEDVERQLLKASEVADMVIIGSTSTSPDPEKARRLVKLAKRYFDTVGFDSMFLTELNAVEADLYLSLDKSKLDKFKHKDEAVVIIPGDLSSGSWPLNAEDKVISLKNNLERAEELGIEKVIVDPVLSPFPNALESLVALREVSKKVKAPLMIGLSNFVELTDADSPGQMATLATLALEAGVSLLMVTEHSDKCVGAWAEAKVAAALASVAKRRHTQPKDLGLDLLILKEKRIQRESITPRGKKLEPRDYKFNLEKTVVRIWVDENVKVQVMPNEIWLEGNAYLIGKTLIAEGLVREPSHALYLGWELHKAHLAWKLNKSYIQEEPLKFETPREKLEKAGLLRVRGKKGEDKGSPQS